MSDQLSFELPEQPLDPDATGEIPVVTGPAPSPAATRRDEPDAFAAAQVSLFDLPAHAPDAVGTAPVAPSDEPTQAAAPPPAGGDEEFPADSEGEPIEPAPQAAAAVPTRRRDSALLWVGSGATLGLIALIAFGGGLGSDPSPSRRAATTTVGTASSTPGPTAGTAPARPTATATTTGPQPLTLTLAAQPNTRVYVEVRRAGATGAQLYGGTLDARTVKRFTAPAGAPLWINVAWAPNLAVTINGRTVAAPGGTVVYEATTRGLRTLDDPYRTGG